MRRHARRAVRRRRVRREIRLELVDHEEGARTLREDALDVRTRAEVPTEPSPRASRRTRDRFARDQVVVDVEKLESRLCVARERAEPPAEAQSRGVERDLPHTLESNAELRADIRGHR